MCIRRAGGRRRNVPRPQLSGKVGAARLSEVQMRVGGLVLLIWLVIGAIAAGQRGYYGSSAPCAHPAPIIVPIAAGPPHLVGAHPPRFSPFPPPRHLANP